MHFFAKLPLPRRNADNGGAFSAIALIWISILASVADAAAQGSSVSAAFEKCLACHAVGDGAQNKNGPVLNGIAGKAVASAAGFSYSEALQNAKASGLIWTDANLDSYLADPTGFLPGGRMAWAVTDEAERRTIIAYLKTLP